MLIIGICFDPVLKRSHKIVLDVTVHASGGDHSVGISVLVRAETRQNVESSPAQPFTDRINRTRSHPTLDGGVITYLFAVHSQADI
jgi:hypothetical protein